MKRKLLIATFCLISVLGFAQEQITEELKNAYNQQQYDLILSNYADKAADYPAKAVYYIAMAYYMKADDNNAVKLMNLSIEKDNTDPDAYYIKGMTYNYMGSFEEAIESFDKAIELDSTNSNYYSGLGDSYISQKKYEKALSAYETATEQKNPVERPFTMIPQIYAQLEQPDKALEAFYSSRAKISKESDSYIIALYNIGVYEYLNKEYDKSEQALKELLEIAPNDYESYVKLIQVYYGKGEYESAKPLKKALYQARENGLLNENLKEQFCFDQFDWNDKFILAYERFALQESGLYYKHIFYITNNKGETEFTIQTENSPISIEMGGPKYLLGMDKDGTHSTFRFGFEEDFNYDDLKKTVFLVLEEKVKAGSSSRKVKK